MPQATAELDSDIDFIDVNDDTATDTPPAEKEDNGNTPDAPDVTPGDDEPAPAPAPAGGHIPKARFNEVISQRETLKAQNAELQRQLEEVMAATRAPAQATQPQVVPQPAAPELKALRAQHREAMFNGDSDKAAELEEQIDAVVIDIAAARITSQQTQAQAANDLQAEADKSVAAYPYLNTPEGKEACDLIIMLRDQKTAAGIRPAQALREAVAAIAPRFAPAAENSDTNLTNSTKAVDNRVANAVARGAADSNLQPPAPMAGVGNRATEGRVDVSKLTDDQFANLSEADKKRLRGDM
jgi:hypothetical protein